MLIPRSARGATGQAAPRHVASNPTLSGQACKRTTCILAEFLVGVLALAVWASPLQAGSIYLPNASFESPVVPPISPYAIPDMDDWQKSLQPAWYDPSTNYDTPWEDLTGTFYNVPFPGQNIDNCDGAQAAFLQALPTVAIFQDYDSIGGTNTTPTHGFNARFSVGHSYRLTVGVIGGGGGMPPGATLQLSLYYRDASSNMVTVAATTITNSADLFPTNTHLVDFSLYVPDVQATNAWAGQNIGVQIASTVGFDLAGGYWDVDNARLTETLLPALSDARVTNGLFGFTLQSQPGLRFEVFAASDPGLALSNWSSLGTLTNDTGAVPFLDPTPSLNRRFYRARQLP